MRKLIITVMLAIAGMASASAENHFDAYRNKEYVEVVQISKAMLRLANPNLGVSPIGSISALNLGDKLDNIEVLSVDGDMDIANKISKELDGIFSQKKGYEVLMAQSSGDDESVKILFRKGKKGVSNEFVVINHDESDMQAVVLSGSFTLADLPLSIK
ncbi:MAG: DUF4252 domain-containing protein [Muribaculaceae bacterium]|nr:DUF4252 domain-containing protein [Muribaculaceae bacterium]